MLSLLLHEIRIRRGAIIGWSIGLSLFVLMYTLLYPDLEEQMASLADISIYQAMGIEVATFEGYLGTTIIGFIPILLGVYGVLTSTNALAGEEDNGTLEMLLTTRLKRWHILAAKAAALIIVATIITLITAAVTVLAVSMISDQVTISVSNGLVFAVVMSSLPLVIVFMMMGLFFGTIMPNRRLAMMAALVVLIVSYFGENLGTTISSVDFLKPLSLFTYFDSSSAVFVDGVPAGNIALLLALGLLFFGLAIVSFQRRDVTVGNWPWQRVRLSE